MPGPHDDPGRPTSTPDQRFPTSTSRPALPDQHFPTSTPTSTARRPAIDAGETSATDRGRGAAASLTAFLDAWVPEEPALQSARQRAAEVGISAVDAHTGSVLRLLTHLISARTVVEIGTGAGVSTLWLLRGMRPDGVLTTVDVDGEHQRLARLSIAEAGIPTGRVRLIAGRALEVLPRLSDRAYDVVFCDAARAENDEYLDAALRLLRPGGMVMFTGALAGGRIAETSTRDPETVAMRELGRRVREEPHLVPVLLPVGSGLLVASVSR